MKYLLFTIATILSTTITYSQEATIKIIPEDVVITRDKKDTEGYVKGEEIYVSHSRVYGKANKIREMVIKKLKVVASEKGYRLALIVKDDFSFTPINNVSMVAIGYK